MSKPLIRSVSLAAAQDLIDTCTRLNLLSEQERQVLGLDKSPPDIATARIPESTLVSLWQTISERDNETGLGLIIGQTINPGAKGLLASWVSQSENLREALTIFRENTQLMNPSEQWDVIENCAQTKLIFELKKELNYPDIAIERSMSAMLTWARALSGQTFPIEGVEFEFPAPRYIHKYHRIFGKNIAFNCNKNQIILNATILDLPVVSNNPYLKSLIETRARHSLEEIKNQISARSKVKDFVRSAIVSGGVPTITDASNALAMSRQTLYRQLKKEDTGFQDILDSVRKEETLKRLQRGHSPSSIYYEVGFKDNSSFYKAFKRWFSVSPREYVRTKY